MQILQLIPVVVLLMLSSSITTANAQRSACKVEYTKVICTMATLYYSVGEYNGKTVFCGRLEVTNGGVGWIALGVSSLGGAQAMGGSGSVAIIGNPIDGSVTVYDLYGIPSNGIVEIEKSAIAILESSTKVTGTKTIMEFTKYEQQQQQQQQQQLNNNDNDYASFANPTNYILHARGMSNTIGYHGDSRFSFKIDLPTSSTTTTTTTTTATTSATAKSTTTTTATTAMTTATSTKASTTTTTSTTQRPPIRKPTMIKPEKTKSSKMKRPRPIKTRPGNNVKPMNNNNNNNKPAKKKKKKKKKKEKKPTKKKKKTKRKEQKKKKRQPRLIFN